MHVGPTRHIKACAARYLEAGDQQITGAPRQRFDAPTVLALDAHLALAFICSRRLSGRSSSLLSSCLTPENIMNSRGNNATALRRLMTEYKQLTSQGVADH